MRRWEGEGLIFFRPNAEKTRPGVEEEKNESGVVSEKGWRLHQLDGACSASRLIHGRTSEAGSVGGPGVQVQVLSAGRSSFHLWLMMNGASFGKLGSRHGGRFGNHQWAANFKFGRWTRCRSHHFAELVPCSWYWHRGNIVKMRSQIHVVGC